MPEGEEWNELNPSRTEKRARSFCATTSDAVSKKDGGIWRGLRNHMLQTFTNELLPDDDSEVEEEEEEEESGEE